MEDIGSTVGIEPYRGYGYEGAIAGKCFAISRHLHLYVIVVFSGSRVVCDLWVREAVCPLLMCVLMMRWVWDRVCSVAIPSRYIVY